MERVLRGVMGDDGCDGVSESVGKQEKDDHENDHEKDDHENDQEKDDHENDHEKDDHEMDDHEKDDHDMSNHEKDDHQNDHTNNHHINNHHTNTTPCTENLDWMRVTEEEMRDALEQERDNLREQDADMFASTLSPPSSPR